VEAVAIVDIHTNMQDISPKNTGGGAKDSLFQLGGGAMKSHSTGFLMQERSPAHSWQSPCLRPRTHTGARTLGSSRTLGSMIAEPLGQRPATAPDPADGQASQSPSKRSEERWGTGELAQNCKKMVSSSRQDRVSSFAQQLSSGSDGRLQLTADPQQQELVDNGQAQEIGQPRAGIPLEPHKYEKSWGHFMTTSGRCTMEMDQPTLRHYLHYGRFQGNAYFYKGIERDSRFTHDVFNTVPGLTNLTELRRGPRRPTNKIDGSYRDIPQHT